MEFKEIFKFDAESYTKEAKSMTTDSLWAIERNTLQSKIAAGTGVAVSSVLLPLTLGISSIALAYSSRAIDVARKKVKIVQAELQRRNLPLWDETWRDYAIPIALTFTVRPFTEIIDIFGVPATEAARTWAEKHLDQCRIPQGRQITQADIVKVEYAQKLPEDTSTVYVYLSRCNYPISQPITAQDCPHTLSTAGKRCRFCEETIDSSKERYYHCCECCSASGYDICEVCVAGRGCSCPHRESHVLFRQGAVGGNVANYGNLSHCAGTVIGEPQHMKE